jgi:hypothetical protein
MIIIIVTAVETSNLTYECNWLPYFEEEFGFTKIKKIILRWEWEQFEKK